MKTKLFLFAILLNALISSLQAVPGRWCFCEDRSSEETEQKKAERQQELEERLRSLTEHHVPREETDDSDTTFIPLEASISTESGARQRPQAFEDLSSEQKAARLQKELSNVRCSIRTANLPSSNWEKAEKTIQRALDWSKGELRSIAEGNHEIAENREDFQIKEQAELIQAQAIVLKALSPAFKQSGLAQKAVTDSKKSETTSFFDRFNFWSRKDRDAEVLQKVKAAETAWAAAKKNLNTQIDKLPGALQTHVKKRLAELGCETEERQVQLIANDLLNQPTTTEDLFFREFLNERQHVDYAAKAAGICNRIIETQQKIEKFLADREGKVYQEKEVLIENGQNSFDESMNSLRNIAEEISQQKTTSVGEYQKKWEQQLTYLNYVIAGYEARMATISFDEANANYQKNKETSFSKNDLFALKDRGAEALEKWKAAINAKIATLPQGSYKVIYNSLRVAPSTRVQVSSSSPSISLEPTSPRVDGVPTPQPTFGAAPLAVEEEAARKRLLQFCSEYESIETVLSGFNSNSHENLDQDDSQDGFSVTDDGN